MAERGKARGMIDRGPVAAFVERLTGAGSSPAPAGECEGAFVGRRFRPTSACAAEGGRAVAAGDLSLRLRRCRGLGIGALAWAGI